MKAFVKLGWVAASFLLAQACSKNDGGGGSQTTFQGAAYTKVGEGDLKVSEDSMSGTGKIVFEAPLAGISTGAHFKTTVSLNDGGMMRLVTFANNDLTGGLELVMSRAGDVLTAKLVQGEGETDLSAAFSGAPASEPLTVQVDVHNDETPAHVLVWSGTETAFGEESALFNTEEGGEAPGNGKGTYWGVALDNATLSAASSSEPKFEEK